MPPQYAQPQRRSRKDARLDEYQRFQQSQAMQQAQMMQMLQTMYGINERQQLLPGQLQQQQDQSAVAQNQLEVSRQMTPTQLAAIQADTQYRQGLTSMQPDQQRGLQLGNEGQSLDNLWKPILNTSALAQQGAATANLAATAEGQGIQNANAPAKNALELQGMEANIARLGADTAGELERNNWIKPLAQNQLNLGNASIQDQQSRAALNLYGMGGLSLPQVQEASMPGFYQTNLKPVYDAADATNRNVVTAEFGGKPMDDTTRAALVGRYGEEFVRNLPPPQTTEIPETYGSVYGQTAGDAIKDKVMRMHQTFNPWMIASDFLNKPYKRPTKKP